MHRINHNTVDLDHREVVANRYFEELLDDGLTQGEAADRIERFGRRTTPYDPAFIAYLRD